MDCLQKLGITIDIEYMVDEFILGSSWDNQSTVQLTADNSSSKARHFFPILYDVISASSFFILIYKKIVVASVTVWCSIFELASCSLRLRSFCTSRSRKVSKKLLSQSTRSSLKRIEMQKKKKIPLWPIMHFARCAKPKQRSAMKC